MSMLNPVDDPSYNTSGSSNTFGQSPAAGSYNNTSSGFGGSHTAGPHTSNTANELDPRVDSDRSSYGHSSTNPLKNSTSGYGNNTNAGVEDLLVMPDFSGVACAGAGDAAAIASALANRPGPILPLIPFSAGLDEALGAGAPPAASAHYLGRFVHNVQVGPLHALSAGWWPRHERQQETPIERDYALQSGGLLRQTHPPSS